MCNSGFGGNNCLWILILLMCCGGDNCGNGFGGDNCMLIIILLLCCGGLGNSCGNDCGCGNDCCC